MHSPISHENFGATKPGQDVFEQFFLLLSRLNALPDHLSQIETREVPTNLEEGLPDTQLYIKRGSTLLKSRNGGRSFNISIGRYKPFALIPE